MLEPWSLQVALIAFTSGAIVLLAIGSRLAKVVDEIADRTGMGEAVAGALLLGATTSLPGLVSTLVGALAGDASFAASNALGGICAQTMFLALADLSYRRANLEHAAASVPNLLQALTLIVLCGLVLVATTAPHLAWGSVHVVTPLLVVVYLGGLRLTRSSHAQPMWWPRRTGETKTDEPEPVVESAVPLSRLWLRFAWQAGVMALVGFVIGQAGVSLVAETGLKGSVVGGLLTSVVTSLPELVTVFASVRLGALTLAVGDIVGGNTFDVLFLALADLAYRPGPIYSSVDPGTEFLVALALLMTATLACGLVVRESKGIGFEGVSLLVIYGLGVVVLLTF